jgi:hypothetical protein
VQSKARPLKEKPHPEFEISFDELKRRYGRHDWGQGGKKVAIYRKGGTAVILWTFVFKLSQFVN